MSNSTRALLALVFVAVIAGCAKKEEVVVAEPLTTDTADTGKFK